MLYWVEECVSPYCDKKKAPGFIFCRLHILTQRIGWVLLYFAVVFGAVTTLLCFCD